MSNVIALPGAKPIPTVEMTDKPIVDESLVEALEQLVSLAKEGRLTWFVGTGFTNDECRLTFWGGPYHHDAYRGLGSVQWLAHEYVDRLLDRAED